MSRRNTLAGKAERRAERRERKARAQLERDISAKVREEIEKAKAAEAAAEAEGEDEVHLATEQGWPTVEHLMNTNTVSELRLTAADMLIEGRSNMNKEALATAILERMRDSGAA